jgi:hypothetical protein
MFNPNDNFQVRLILVDSINNILVEYYFINITVAKQSFRYKQENDQLLYGTTNKID